MTMAQGADAAADEGPVSVLILDREYLINCPPDEREELAASAKALNMRLREIRESGKVIGIERMAVMAALNMANELTKLNRRGAQLETQVGLRVKHLRERVEKAVTLSQQLEL